MLITGVLFAAAVVLIKTLIAYIAFQKQMVSFSRKPFCELTNNGFIKHYIHKENEWKFSQLVLVGQINDTSLLVSAETHFNHNIIIVSAFRADSDLDILQPISKNEHLGKEQEYKMIQDIYPENGSAVDTYNDLLARFEVLINKLE